MYQEKETPKQQQSREDCQKKPPTEKCKVYVWRQDRGSGYTCESIFQSENEDKLDFCRRNQKVYEAFSNCWDLCKDFGAVEPDEFDPNDDDNNLFPPCDPPSVGSPPMLHWCLIPNFWQSLPLSSHRLLHFPHIKKHGRFLALQPQDIHIRDTRHLSCFMIIWALCIPFLFHSHSPLLLIPMLKNLSW